MGNLWSVRSAVSYLGYNPIISSSRQEIENANALILPGVGSFRSAMQALQDSGLDKAILEGVSNKQHKILGICLGMQLLAMQSTEGGETKGLGLIPTKVERFDHNISDNLKVPHIGFNEVRREKQSILFKDISQLSAFYFVHSYCLHPDNLKGLNAICHYGQDFLAAYEYENIFATQFHPEKSQTNGLKLLKNFLEY